MSGTQRHTPWPNVYQTKGQCEVSWFQETPAVSLELIHATGVSIAASIIGGGASRLVGLCLAIATIGRFAPRQPGGDAKRG